MRELPCARESSARIALPEIPFLRYKGSVRPSQKKPSKPMLLKKRTLLSLFAFGLIVSLLLALTTSSRAQKDPAAKDNTSGTTLAKAPFVAGPAIASRAIGFGETRPVREFASQDLQTDAVLVQAEAEEINPLNSGEQKKPDPNAPAQKDGALQASWTLKDGFTLKAPTIPSP
ncbi:MAG: hypothetical protein M3Y80_05550, partial [Verrucomicrobiota bacterium]|nr:hypothetical protein [Verrucomicrobiota bacterium]